MKNTLRKNLIVIFLVSALSACGFHLRGNYVLPVWFNQVYIKGLQNANSDFRVLLLRRLQANNIKVVNRLEQANSVVNLLEDKLTRNVFATSANTGIASSYQITYYLQYEVYSTKGPNKIAGQFQQADNYEFDSDDLLGASERERVITDTLLNDAVNSVFSHISRKK